MSKPLPFVVVDVFAERKYAGNQLAVFTHPGELSSAVMQQIAREMNLSETTFIFSPEPRDGGYDVRIFALREEVPFAGHPTLGTAWVIREQMAPPGVNSVTLNLKVGPIPVCFEPNGLGWMTQKAPEFGPVLDQAQVARAGGLKPEALDARFPVQEVSTGLPFVIAPLRRLEDLKQARTDYAEYCRLIDGIQAKAILFFCPESHEAGNHLSARMFADYYGVPEDPATGSANGCLAAWLVRHRYFGTPEIDVRVEQGYEIGRPSLLYLRAAESKGRIQVRVGGKVVLVARGELE